MFWKKKKIYCITLKKDLWLSRQLENTTDQKLLYALIWLLEQKAAAVFIRREDAELWMKDNKQFSNLYKITEGEY